MPDYYYIKVTRGDIRKGEEVELGWAESREGVYRGSESIELWPKVQLTHEEAREWVDNFAQELINSDKVRLALE